MSLNYKLLPDKGYGRLEPDVAKVASPVLRRGRASNRSFLFGKARPMQYEKSDELIVAMIVEPVIHRTCAAGCRGRLCEDKTQLSEGVLALDRVERFSMITSIG
jgi:hypothetical protein